MSTDLAVCAWLFLLLLAIAARDRLRRDTLPSAEPGEGCSSLSVIVSIRNEAPRIATMLRSLLEQDHPRFEVIVVDDRSTDGSGRAALAAAEGDTRVRLLRVDALPEGWQGRLFAQAFGTDHASGEWILFLSADQRLASPGLLRALVARYERDPDGGVAIIGPFAGRRWWDWVWVRPILNSPVVMGTIFLCQRWLPHSVWLIGALGMRRATHSALRGSAAVRECGAGLFEDFGWARAFARAGRPARTLYCPQLLDVTNWDGPRPVWYGLCRWIAGVFTYRNGGWVVASVLIAALAAVIVAASEVIRALAAGELPSLTAVALAAIAPTLGWSYCRWDRRSLGFALAFWGVAPLALAVLVGGAWARLRNRVLWREDVLRLVAKEPEFADFGQCAEARAGEEELDKP
jgi:Glycosyl transferase family 2